MPRARLRRFAAVCVTGQAAADQEKKTLPVGYLA